MEHRVSMWEHEDQPHVRDYLMAVVFATALPVARLILDSLVFEVNREPSLQMKR